jgi:hypothetical protein
MTRIKVSVTQEHIDNGNPSSRAECPVALALTAYFSSHVPGLVSATPLSGKIGLWTGRVYRPSRRCGQFIRRFDAGKPVQPATFYLTQE